MTGVTHVVADPADADAVLVLDAGSSSGRATLVDVTGRRLSHASRRWSWPVRRDGAQDLPLDAIAETLDTLARDVLTRHRGPIRAVTTSSVRGAMVVLDADEEPLWACGSGDARAAEEVGALAAVEASFHLLTGQKATLAAGPRLRWLARHHPDVVDRAEAVVSLDTWMLRRLGGSATAGSVSNGSTLGLMDIRRRTWVDDPDDGAWWGDRLPALAEGGQVAGIVDRRGAERTGLPVGTPIVTGGADAQLAALGLGAIDAGHLAVVMGTHWQQTLTSVEPWTDPAHRVRTIAHAAPDRWQLDAIAWSAGRFLDWCSEAFGDGGDPTDAFTGLAVGAASLPPGADGVLAVAGLPMTGPRWGHASPSLSGWSLDRPGARAAAFRAVIEAGCFTVRENLAVLLDAAGGHLGRGAVLHVGGGASRSRLVCRILADATGRPVERATDPECSTLGGAMCAWVGAGVHGDLPAARDAMIHAGETIEPDAQAVEAYGAVFPRWRAFADSQRLLAEKHVTEPVWRPAT